MKKIFGFLLIIMALLFHFGCDKPGIEVLFNLTNGSGSYSSALGQSTFQVTGNIDFQQSNVSNNGIKAEFISWSFLIKEGGNVVLEINNGNYLATLGLIFQNISGWEGADLWVYLETISPVAGDLYNGSNPDSVEFIADIWDENEYRYTVSGSGPFTFTRN